MPIKLPLLKDCDKLTVEKRGEVGIYGKHSSGNSGNRKKYADIMSKIARVEVEVVDDKLLRVAGTGIFADHINENMSQEGYVYRHILKTGETEVVYEPGKEKLCQKCPKRENCREKIEISMPLRLGSEIIGGNWSCGKYGGTEAACFVGRENVS